MPMIVLHQWEMSPFCNKVRRCLRLKGLDFRVENYNGLKARQAAKLTAQGMLPVLDYENQRIGDSAAIAEFLERHHPDPPLYPKDPEASARARFWESWAGEVLYFFEIQFRMLDPEAREKALDIICEGRPAHERAILGFVFKTRYPGKLKSQGLGRLSPAEIERKFFGHLDDLAALLDRHEWLVGDASFHARHRTGTEAAHGDRPDEVSLPPLSTRTTTLTLAAGVYTYICHFPLHEQYGMIGIVTAK